MDQQKSMQRMAAALLVIVGLFFATGAVSTLAPSERVVDVSTYGALPDLVSDTTAIQKALDAVGSVSGGGEVHITRPGTYLLTVQGNHPYTTGKYCLDLKHNNVSLVLGPGVTLKLADGQQTDAGGRVDIIAFRDRTNLYIGGRGRITGNTAGQSGWTGGYAQISNGLIISGFGTTGNGNHNITIEGLQLDDHFSNPVNIDNNATGRGSRITLKNLYGFNCGEGFQLIRVDHLSITGCVYKDTADVAVGDGIEISNCDYFTIDQCKVSTNGAGTAFDIFGSKYGTLSNFVIDGWASGIGAEANAGRISEHISVGPGVIVNTPGAALFMPDGAVTFHGLTVSGCDTTPFQIAGDSTEPPVIMLDCYFKGKTGVAGPDIRGRRAAIIKGCVFDSMGAQHGLRVFAIAADDTPRIIIDGNQFINNTNSGLDFNHQGQTGFAPHGYVRNNIFSGNGSPWSFASSVDFSNLEVDLAYGTKTATLVAGVNANYAIGTARTLKLTGDASGSYITGFAVVDGDCPQKLTVMNVSANGVTLANQSTSSPANRIIVPGGGVAGVSGVIGLTLGQWDTAELEYDKTQQRWVVVRTSALYKEDATTISALVNGTNAQTLNNYSTFTANNNYQRLAMKSAKTTLSAVSGATVTATNLIPDGAFVVGVTTRVTTALGTTSGTTGYTVGDGSGADLWGTITGTIAGTDTDSSNFTAAGAVGLYTSAQNVVVTATGGNFDGTGAIEVCVHYLTTEAQ